VNQKRLKLETLDKKIEKEVNFAFNFFFWIRNFCFQLVYSQVTTVQTFEILYYE
jgi:hypothetical protein